MKLTRAGDYAIRLTLYCAAAEPGRIIKRKDVVQNMQIPDAFLRKIAQKLAAAGILNIVQGARGGFVLMRPPEKLTVLDVVETVEGGIFLNECISRPQSCSLKPSCVVHPVWEEARRKLRETLASANFADLASKSGFSDLLEQDE